MWQQIRKVLGLITDFLTFGRSKGWWKKRGGIPGTPTMRDPREHR